MSIRDFEHMLPEDLPQRPTETDPDLLPERGRYQHKPITLEQIRAVIEVPDYQPGWLTKRQAE